MRVAIFGGTGFVGSYLVKLLLEEKYEISLLTRSENKDKIISSNDCKTIVGSIQSKSAIKETILDCDCVIYNIGILKEYPKQGITFQALQLDGLKAAVDESKRVGIKKFILMSANGVDAKITPYQKTKYDAEEYLKKSELRYSIFRPSIIFGDPSKKMEFVTQLYKDMVQPPIPAINFYNGSSPIEGSIKMSPVHVEDVAIAFYQATIKESTDYKTIVLGGPETLSWYEILNRIMLVTSKKKIIFPMPIKLMKIAASLFQWISLFPVTLDQLKMLEEENIANSSDLCELIEKPLTLCDTNNLSYLLKND
ncbi:MAG: nucleoside-diphosphate-sugar epimerase [Woeseiaceae bacterium]|jgi:nucleoside-diphosphate-sugar epimerase|tara:strand:+ start:27445 stop:28371 length:927 start_codon:yes stop_codon:yes gene_type:complete